MQPCSLAPAPRRNVLYPRSALNWRTWTIVTLLIGCLLVVTCFVDSHRENRDPASSGSVKGQAQTAQYAMQLGTVTKVLPHNSRHQNSDAMRPWRRVNGSTHKKTIINQALQRFFLVNCSFLDKRSKRNLVNAAVYLWKKEKICLRKKHLTKDFLIIKTRCRKYAVLCIQPKRTKIILVHPCDTLTLYSNTLWLCIQQIRKWGMDEFLFWFYIG